MNIPTQLPGNLRCRNHPDREGVGICVNCRTVVCVECTTRVDRMNYCMRCLRSARGPSGSKSLTPGVEVMLAVPTMLLSLLIAGAVFGLLGYVIAALRQGGGVSAG